MSASEKQSVALWSMLASAVLAGSKLLAATFTGSLGILSEAIHSVIDFGATIITWFAIRWSDQPPDDEHHYGHAKIESIAALVETGLLFVTTGWIVWEAVSRLITGESHVEVTWWAVAIIAASILIDLNRSRALNRVAKKTSSEALEADALHFSSDMWGSIFVLIGRGAVWYGVPYADAVACRLDDRSEPAPAYGRADWRARCAGRSRRRSACGNSATAPARQGMRSPAPPCRQVSPSPGLSGTIRATTG